MPSLDVNPTPAAEAGVQEQDLGPLAWVLDELRKSLNAASKAMRHFMREAEEASKSDLGALDAGPLRVARQQLHQASGALEMVGMAPPSLLLRAMEAAVHKFVQQPQLCTQDAVTVVERASFALVEYLENVLAGKSTSPVALFPQYRDVQKLAGAERVHPADLWPSERRLREPEVHSAQAPLPYGASARSMLDAAVLQVVKSGDPSAARRLRDICLGFAAAQDDVRTRTFWKICAGFFEALAGGLLPADIYVKRVASRVLMQYATLAKGEDGVAERLLQDLLFFCAQARPSPEAVDAYPVLGAVRRSYGLEHVEPVSYETPRFGRFDPVLLAQARKRMAAAAEIWSALAGGDRSKLKPAADQFSLVCDSLRKLLPGSEALAEALAQAVQATSQSGTLPTPALAMEVATAVLYLQAVFEGFDANDAQMALRAQRLAQRLSAVRNGAEPEPLEPWMEELYRRISDKQTMGSVVAELRTTLGEVEVALDQFFRAPDNTTPLATVPARMAQMRGVLSVLGIDQAALAMARMRDIVERLLVGHITAEERLKAFERLGNSLGALGFLIDMLSYQRNMARRLFVYDETLGELRILTSKARMRTTDDAREPSVLLRERANVPQPQILPRFPAPESAQPPTDFAPLSAAQDSSANAEALADEATTTPWPQEDTLLQPLQTILQTDLTAPADARAEEKDEAEEDLRDIFLEEAREVVDTGLAAVAALQEMPADLSEQTTLRRAFHTLKGSSRMVGLGEFGEAAWAMEQVLNAWLAEQKPIPYAMLQLSSDALHAFGQWANDIGSGTATHWNAQAFRVSADAMRLHGTWVPLATPTDQPSVEPTEGTTELQEAEETSPPSEPAFEPSTSFAETAFQTELDPSTNLEPVDFVPGAAFVAEEVDFSEFAAAAQEKKEEKREAAEGFAPTVIAQLAPEHAPDDMFPPSAPESETELLDTQDAFAGFMQSQPSAPPSDAADAEQAAQFGSAAAEKSLTEKEEAPSAPASESEQDSVKIIGDLRIGVALYNVYLNEADEWSRALENCLQEWASDPSAPIPDDAVAWAHSLAGSSATVGFRALSDMARLLEHALQHVQLQAAGTAAQAQTFLAAGQDIRRLLHQFAAGFLKSPNAQILQELQQILDTEESTLAMPLQTQADVDEKSLALEVEAVPPKPTETPPLPAPPTAPDLPEPAAMTGSVVEQLGSDIDAKDTIDPDLFPIFEEEAQELLPQLGSALRQWASRPGDMEARHATLRALHTLKGSARLAGAMRLGEMAHRLESLVEQLDMHHLQTVQVESLLSGFDAIQSHFDDLCLQAAQASQAPLLPPPTTAQASNTAQETDSQEPLPNTAADHPTPSTPEPSLPGPAPLVLARLHSAPSVRVRAPLLDRLVNQAGEVLISHSRLDAHVAQLRGSLGELTSNLERLRQQLRDIEVQAESQMQSRLAQTKDSATGFDPLEFDRFTRVQELTRMMAESVNDVATVQRNLQRAIEGAEDELSKQGRQARDLQRDLLRTRMVEFDAIAERLYTLVRQASKETGKQVQLHLRGGSIEMDRGVLDRMVPVFEHLLRNCVAHGIEPVEQRLAQGKPAAGAIDIDVHYEGNDVALEFRDDGCGLDLARIRAKALAQGLLAAGTDPSNADVANLIFQPGFSTASEVSGLAGRGIGLDVVRSEVNALGGRVEVSSVPGKGTTFRLILPLTTAVTQVVLLRAGHLTVGMPANLVEIVRRATADDLEQAYRTGYYEEAGERLPFFWAGAMLQSSVRSNEPVGKNRPVIIARSAAQRIAMHVDEVLGNQEVVVKQLGPQLSRLPGLAGISVLSSGAVVLIYNPVALATVYGDRVRAAGEGLPAVLETAVPGTQPGTPHAPHVLHGSSHVPLVLVVDDSITVRRVTQRLLQREGYRVALAADGLQALERLQQERPAVVLSDIEMPRMDGFDLLRTIRADQAMHDLPVIMITSRIAQKHREHALELGANHYLGKPYSDEELLGLIAHYATLKAAALV
mgnify:CR=1 FL=1